jgi:hypothetical protein
LEAEVFPAGFALAAAVAFLTVVVTFFISL